MNSCLHSRTVETILGGMFLALVLMSAAGADELVSVRIDSAPPLPRVVRDELSDIFADTLTSVLFEGASSEELRSSDPVQVAEAIRTGINIVIESKGYTVEALELDLTNVPVTAFFIVHPAGWTEDDPGAVTDVVVSIAGDGLDKFWLEALGARLEKSRDAVLEVYRGQLCGLPAEAADEKWVLDLVVPEIEAADPAADLFPGFAIGRSVDLGPTAHVVLSLTPMGDTVELVRPLMFSRTLYNLILDRFRERLLSEADFIEGMPKSEIQALGPEIAARLETLLGNDDLARTLNARVAIEVSVAPDEPVALVTAVIESCSYDLALEAFMDFGNESRDSSEIQSRLGFFIARGVEAFVNLNYFTNDSTLETDAGLGFLPDWDTFLAVAYDFEREAPKYFFERVFAHSVRIRGEIFDDDELNEFGITYQFHQYLSAGAYTNGDNEYWVRAILKL